MPNRKRSTGPRAPPKLFRCTGYGDCNMVFTRSEHLARHERKHTGEKPYKCIVPGCDRMFSRFDNMMQHTQTHEKNRNKTSRPSASRPQRETPIQNDSLSMLNSRTLPLPRRRSSMTNFPTLNDYRSSYPSAIPSYYDTPRNRASWPMKQEPYSYYNDRRSSISSSESSLVSPMSANFPKEPEIVRRRISIDDLRLPIEDLKNIDLEEKAQDKGAVDLTQDEFEALEGFSKFHANSVIAPTSPCSSEAPKLFMSGSPNYASQVCAMRQRVMTSHESYQRG